jgi:hypothetical protein
MVKITIKDVDLDEFADASSFVAMLVVEGFLEEPIEVPVEIVEGIQLAADLRERLDLWLSTRRRELEKKILSEDPVKKETLKWMHENAWDSLDWGQKLWLMNRVVSFRFNPDGKQHDRRIEVPLHWELGYLLSELPDEHYVLELFEVTE